MTFVIVIRYQRPLGAMQTLHTSISVPYSADLMSIDLLDGCCFHVLLHKTCDSSINPGVLNCCLPSGTMRIEHCWTFGDIGAAALLRKNYNNALVCHFSAFFYAVCLTAIRELG